MEDVELRESTKYEDREEATDIQIALSKLNKTDRIIVSLCVVEGYKSHEVGKDFVHEPVNSKNKAEQRS